MKKRLLLLLVAFGANAQTVYLNTRDKQIYRANPDNSITLMTTTDIVLNDIAISTNGDFYGVTEEGKIVSVNTQTGATTILFALPAIPSASVKSLVCNDQNELFFINNTTPLSGKLYKYSLGAQTLTFVGDAPATPGDLTFYKGNLIFPGDAMGNDSWIKAYDLKTNAVKTIYNGSPTNVNFWFFGMTNRYSSCNGNEIIGWQEYVYNYDLENHTVVQSPLSAVANAGIMQVNGLASDNEYMASNPDCYEVLETLHISEFGLDRTGLFPNPTADMFSISTAKSILGVEVYTVSGQKIKTFTATEKTFSIAELDSGVYFVKILTANGSALKKVVKN